MIHDESEKIFGNFSVVEKRVDQNLMSMPIVSPKCDVAKAAFSSSSPSNCRIVFGREKLFFDLFIDRSEIVDTPERDKKIGRDSMG